MDFFSWRIDYGLYGLRGWGHDRTEVFFSKCFFHAHGNVAVISNNYPPVHPIRAGHPHIRFSNGASRAYQHAPVSASRCN
jgi:hypothetical protein